MPNTTTVSLGEVERARTRTLARRSAVLVRRGYVAAGTANGTVSAHDLNAGTERWSVDGRGAVVSLTQFDGHVVAGERSPAGAVRCIDAASGAVRWTYATSRDVGERQRESPNFDPTVVEACADGQSLYVAVRRMALCGDERAYSSVVYAFDTGGRVRWRYVVDASVSGLDVREDRLAVAYNRCPGSHESALVVLDAKTGSERWTWVPERLTERLVGDVALVRDGVAVTNYGDCRGYFLDADGNVRWRADLGTPVAVDGEVVLAYPSRVHAAAGRVAFVTGSSYLREGRDPSAGHPHEYQVRCYSTAGKHQWDADVGGLTRELAGDGTRLLVPSAQNRREPGTSGHAAWCFDLVDGEWERTPFDGIVTAASLSARRFAVVEEPVAHYNEEVVRGAYRLHVERVPGR